MIQDAKGNRTTCTYRDASNRTRQFQSVVRPLSGRLRRSPPIFSMLRAFVRWALLGWLLSFQFDFTVLAQAEKPDGPKTVETEARAEARRLWDEILKSAQRPESEFKEDPDQAWSDVLSTAIKPFRLICLNPGRQEKITYFVEQFGQHGPVADLTWCLVQLSWNLMPALSKELAPRNAIDSDYFRDLRSVQLCFAEAKVKRFLAKPKLLSRYNDFFAWQGLRFTSQNFFVFVADTQNGLRRQDDLGYDEHWLDALQFMMIANATGRDDLLVDLQPENCRQRFRMWEEWGDANHEFIFESKDDWRLRFDANAKEANKPRTAELWLSGVKTPTPFRDWKSPSELPVFRPQ